MLPLTSCYKRKKNNDCQQNAARDSGSSIPLLLTRCDSVYQEEHTTPKYIYLQYPVYNLFRFFWSALIGWQTTTLLAAEINCLTQSGKRNWACKLKWGMNTAKIKLAFCYAVRQCGF